MIQVLAYIVICFTAIQLMVSVVNILFETNLPHVEKKEGPLVSVLIPARNEEENIGNILYDLLAQDYKNLEVIVFNDQSEDRTAAVVDRYRNDDSRVRLINSRELPGDWLGKNFACHSLADSATGEYFLFLDADVRITGNIIGRAVSFSEENQLDMISLFPKQIIETPGEKMTVPVMNYILLSLLPLVLVRKVHYYSLSAANGQFMFFRSDTYRRLLPHEKVRGNMVEDIQIARMYKKAGKKIACLLGDDDMSCRMYKGYEDAVKGFSKNVIAFFGNSFVLAFAFFLITTFGFIPVLLTMPEIFFFAYMTIFIATRVVISAASRQSYVYNLLLILPLQFSLGLFILKAFTNKVSGGFQWKGRNLG
jgi:glycosyltransferase involved in cell wall biosynthesis